MEWFNKLPGFVRSAPGWEHRVWRRLPAVGWWGTVLPLLIAAGLHLMAPDRPADAPLDPTLLHWDYLLFGVVVLHWTLVLTLAIACFIVRVMKGPAYVADAYPLPKRPGE